MPQSQKNLKPLPQLHNDQRPDEEHRRGIAWKALPREVVQAALGVCRLPFS